MNYELKRCPFCGDYAKSFVRTLYCGDIIEFGVGCSKCGTEKTMNLNMTKSVCFLDVENIMNKVQREWNRRADDA